MSNQIIPFFFPESDGIQREVRVIMRDGEPWFVLRDLLVAMGSKTTTTNALSSIKQGLDEGYSNEIPLETVGGVQQIIVVAEPAATYLVARSNTEQGRKLNRFIHIEVLPSIRKTGHYNHQPNTNSIIIKVEEAQTSFACFYSVGKLCGFENNLLILSANQATFKITGINLLELMDCTHLIASKQEALLVVSDIALRLDCKKREVNPLLMSAGLEIACRDHKNRLYYELTPLGQQFGVYLDTGKRHQDGTPVRQIKWHTSIIEFLQTSVH
ncbi:BRO family protein [Thiospirillum jenense]|uniref:Bro-N domain-containing protein n=1 Tax=Thiospirillum jenense TaxID=1653858 RepID=A0A839H978_9GAMM|nr:hypothetical protein [Thiospirillum jenense]